MFFGCWSANLLHLILHYGVAMLKSSGAERQFCFEGIPSFTAQRNIRCCGSAEVGAPAFADKKFLLPLGEGKGEREICTLKRALPAGACRRVFVPENVDQGATLWGKER